MGVHTSNSQVCQLHLSFERRLFNSLNKIKEKSRNFVYLRSFRMASGERVRYKGNQGLFESLRNLLMDETFCKMPLTGRKARYVNGKRQIFLGK